MAAVYAVVPGIAAPGGAMWTWWAACGGGETEVPPVSSEVASAWAGTWSGALDAGGQPLRLVVHLSAGEGLAGTLDSVDQNALGIPLASVAAGADTLSFRVPSVGGSYEGKLTSPDHLEGTWKQGFGSLPLALVRGQVLPAPVPSPRPQEPVPPLPYTTRELTVTSPGATLSGTWTIPAGSGPFPAVVLVTGSGPQDRDEALAGHRPFLVPADALARAGVASYRYDDRGVGKSTGDFAAATTEDFAIDAAAALEAARQQPEARFVGVLGHSEGGYVASRLVGRGGDSPAFAVLLAGPGTDGRTVLASQVEAISLASGASAAEAKRARAQQEAILGAIVGGGTDAEIEAAMVAAGLPTEQAVAARKTMTSAWYRGFLTFDPAPGLSASKVPVLALLGERDVQVPPAENAEALRAALAHDPRSTVVVVPGVNHLFQPATTGAPSEYAAIETTIDPAVLERITSWISGLEVP